MEGREHPGGAHPSWLRERCPDWCTRVHLEDDHPEDRIHQDDGVVMAAVVARVEPPSHLADPRPAEILIRRWRPVGSPQHTWVTIGDTEDARHSLHLWSKNLPELREALNH